MSSDSADNLGADEGMDFPVITISVQYEDINEPVHVDLGSIPPFVAAAILEKVASSLKVMVSSPTITFKGAVLSDSSDPYLTSFLDMLENFMDDDGGDEEGPQ